MEKISFYGNKFLDIIPGAIFGLISVIIGITCDTIAVLIAQSEWGYSILKDMVSTLGVVPGKEIFNTGIIKIREDSEKNHLFVVL